MAELNVQPKKKNSLLPWIIIVAIVVALAWYLSNRKAHEATPGTKVMDTTSTASNIYYNALPKNIL